MEDRELHRHPDADDAGVWCDCLDGSHYKFGIADQDCRDTEEALGSLVGLAIRVVETAPDEDWAEMARLADWLDSQAPTT